MAIPKGLLQIAMQSTRVLKPDEIGYLSDIESDLVKETNNSKLTFRRDSKSISDKLNSEQLNNDEFNKKASVIVSPDLYESRLRESVVTGVCDGSSASTGEIMPEANKNNSNIFPDIVMLTGLEKKIIIYLCEKKEKNDSGKLITKTIYLSILSKDTGISIITIKKSIQRLEKKGFLNRVIFKAGREGWTIYSIPLSVFKGLF